MNRAFRSFFFALVCLAAGTWLLCSPRERGGPEPVTGAAASPVAAPAAAPSVAQAPADPPSAAPAPAVPSRIGFRSRERLAEHFAKHGAEFNAASAEAYLSLAQQLRAAPAGSDILELTRPGDGVISKFDRQSGAFLAFDPDSTIRTFFKPNDGEGYFRRQARRTPRT